MIQLSKRNLSILISNVIDSSEESCGFMLGQRIDTFPLVKMIVPTKNVSKEGKKVRFKISPLDYLKAEADAEKSGLEILGIYHSHIDSDAFPSQTDLAFALQEFSYIIISVKKQSFDHIKSWRLSDQGDFIVERILIVDTHKD